MNKSKAAAGLCDWAINIVKYYDVVSEVEPKRQELAGANEKLMQANTTLKSVQEKVALLNAQVKQLEEQFNAVSCWVTVMETIYVLKVSHFWTEF